jgi:predicted nicotinamide N-methyase
VARYLLNRSWTVAGKRVLDIASGSGLVAIAAALAGAAAVTANDIDPYALAAICYRRNAHTWRPRQTRRQHPPIPALPTMATSDSAD